VAGKQFIVGRSLNRLIKLAFDKHGISMRDPAPILFASPAIPQVTAASARGLALQATNGVSTTPGIGY
jgi:hypothetical protein